MIEEDSRACTLKVGLTSWGSVLQIYKVAPPIMVYCQVTGSNSCDVELVARSTAATNVKALNSLADTLYKTLVYGSLNRVFMKHVANPKIYLDGTLVSSGDAYDENNPVEEFNRRTFKYIFDRIHRDLTRHLAT